MSSELQSKKETMPSEYTQCVFKIETGDGWEKSLTKILSSFENPEYDINPELSYAYVKGKTDRHKILTKLKKGEKHAELIRITYCSEEDNGNNTNNNNNYPYTSLSRMGQLYDPYRYANNPYSNYHPQANYYYPSHNPLFLNNTRNYHGANHHHPHHLPREWRGPFHRLDSSTLTSSSSSPVTSSSSRPVRKPKPKPKPNPPAEPLRSAPSIRFKFIKKVFSIKKLKGVTGKFRKCLMRFSKKFKKFI